MKSEIELSSVMAERLKALRGKLSHDKLSQAITDKYGDTGISISRDSLINYEKVGKKVLGMRAEYLYCLADFYDVSADYILGRTDIKTSDADAQAVIEYTGLTEKNVYALHCMNENIKPSLMVEASDEHYTLDGNKPFLDFLNDMIHIYYNNPVIQKYYDALRQNTSKHEALDPYYHCGLQVLGNYGINIQDNKLAQLSCYKISDEILNSLRDKYCKTENDGFNVI